LSLGFLRAASESIYSETHEEALHRREESCDTLESNIRTCQGAAKSGHGRLFQGLSQSDDRCLDPFGPGGDGLATTDPNSQCFNSISLHARDINSGNKMRACRICKAAAQKNLY
jgi:hypothetical protein